MFLTYHRHRSHLSAAVIKIMQKGVVLTYFLPAHTSGTTQQLNVRLYSLFKNHLDREMKLAAHMYDRDTFDFLDLFHMITRAFESTFVWQNI